MYLVRVLQVRDGRYYLPVGLTDADPANSGTCINPAIHFMDNFRNPT
jgi:hypothetical protein